VVLYFPGPRSFTGQDVLELHLHGSRAVVSDVLRALEAIGQRRHDARGTGGTTMGTTTVRMAEPGEFTQRAFAAGKLDALQTEALADLLRSDTSAQRRQALKQLDGSLSRVYQRWRDELVAGLAHAEAVIDFGDDEAIDDYGDHGEAEDDEEVRGMSVWGNVVDRMDALRSEMRRQLSDERRGELVREGVRIVVAGPPNAGKSTLFNLLARRDAAIVSPVAGTTRDVLEVQLDLGGVKCRLLDTAGVRSETKASPSGSPVGPPGANEIGEIERIGIGRAVAAVREADVVVAMVDAADAEAGAKVLRSIFAPRGKEEAGEEEETDDEDNEDDGRKAPVLLVLNKSDLTNGANTPSATMTREGPPYSSLVSRAGLDRRVERVFEISCATQHGLDGLLSSLAATVVERVNGGGVGGGSDSSPPSSSSVLITRARHRRHVAATVACLDRFLALAGHGAPAMDLAAEELRLAASELGRVTGAVDVEDVLDKLFADFCIGK
jgi:tRNA modification GTPase